MFTGIVEDVGSVVRAESDRIAIKTNLGEVGVGDSLNVNGVCLTVTKATKESAECILDFDFSPETGNRTAIWGLANGSPVNLERALRVGDRFGGHITTGHVENTGVIERIEWVGNARNFTIAVDEGLRRYIIPKGSVGVDGISLTVNECGPATFTVTIIPYTLERTNLASRKVGDHVNIEPDILAKYVEHMLGIVNFAKPITAEFLREHGFIH